MSGPEPDALPLGDTPMYFVYLSLLNLSTPCQLSFMNCPDNICMLPIKPTKQAFISLAFCPTAERIRLWPGMERALVVCVAVSILFSFVTFWLVLQLGAVPAAASTSKPKIYLWAWERCDDLKSLPSDLGVAYLAATVRIEGDSVVCVPRRQPLLVPPGIELISVFRIEVLHGHKAKLDSAAIAGICRIIERWKNYPRVQSIQIDFDALQNERNFYRQLLEQLHRELPERCPLSITVLTSWCLFDRWMNDLPVAERIPMLFSMGRESSQVVAHLWKRGEFDEPSCRRSLGLSLDEPQVNGAVLGALRGREPLERIYIFSSKRWSPELVRQAIKLAQIVM
jgi:hypothetical protein